MNYYLQNFTVCQRNRNQPGTDEHGRKRNLHSIFTFWGRDGRTTQEPHCRRSVSTGHCLSGPPITKGLKWVTNTSRLDFNYRSLEFCIRSLPVISYVKNMHTQSRTSVTHTDHTQPDDKWRPGLINAWAPWHFPGAAAVPVTAQDWMHGARISWHHF